MGTQTQLSPQIQVYHIQIMEEMGTRVVGAMDTHMATMTLDGTVVLTVAMARVEKMDGWEGKVRDKISQLLDLPRGHCLLELVGYRGSPIRGPSLAVEEEES